MQIPHLGEPFGDPPSAQPAGISLLQRWAVSAGSSLSLLKCQICVILMFGEGVLGAAPSPQRSPDTMSTPRT